MINARSIDLLAVRRIRLALLAFCAVNLFGASTAQAIDHSVSSGEPYALAGSRLAFTDWSFIRIGGLDWQDRSGKSVFASAKAKLGPFDATFVSEDTPHGIRLAVEPAEHVGPIIAREKPWEKVGVSPQTLLFQDGKYRLWANCQSGTSKEEKKGGGCYFESTDGKNWTRPDLGLVRFAADKHNNLFGQSYGEIFVDPTASPSQRYKAVHDAHVSAEQLQQFKKLHPYSVFAVEAKPGLAFGLLGAVSPDGFHWTSLPQPLSIEVSDTEEVAYYDQRLKRYVLYTRSYDVGARAPGVSPPKRREHDAVQRRTIGRSESTDFSYFPLSQTVLEAELDRPPTDTFYTNAATTIPGAPNSYLMFPAVYHQDSDTTSIDLYSSDDTYNWHRLGSAPVLMPGRFGAWDGGCVFAHPNLVELPDGSWVLPYTGYAFPHKYPRGAWSFDAGLATWPKGRVVCVDAVDEGSFATVAFVAPAKKVFINALTNRTGSILVEVCDKNGKPVAGHSFADAKPIIGDQFRMQLSWKGGDDLGIDPSGGIMLRIKMLRAKLYSLEFR
jgi:hypothetical protein